MICSAMQRFLAICDLLLMIPIDHNANSAAGLVSGGEKFGEFESPLRQPHFRLPQLVDDLFGRVPLLTRV